MIWLTSDTHFGHDAIRRHSNRPFASVEAMNEALIAAWNARVSVKDDVYHLGDFAFLGEPARQYRVRLHGRIHLVLGNHDSTKDVALAGFEWVKPVHYLRYNRKRVWLSHYAHRTWPNSHTGSFHAFGHSHGNIPGYARSMDVGVDPNGYAPVAFDWFIEQLEREPETHHHPTALVTS